jgi:hypothetical protein
MEQAFRNDLIGCFKMELRNRVVIQSPHIFNRLASVESRKDACPFDGMNFWVIFFAAQVVVSVIGVVRERKQNARFDGDKLGYRS